MNAIMADNLYAVKGTHTLRAVPAGPQQIQKAEETRATIVAEARRLFVDDGYFDTGLEGVATAAQVTRGALYHHFADKKDLYRSVFQQIGEEILIRHTETIQEANAGAIDPWNDLRKGLQLFLSTASADAEVQRIILVDGPAVLGWREWGELEARFSLDLIEAAIVNARDAGIIDAPPARALAHLLLGMLNAGALLVANSDDRETARAEATEAIDALLQGLRADSGRIVDA